MVDRTARIVTNYWMKPIPERGCDWAAYREGYDGAEDSHDLIGYGRTVVDAVADLFSLEADREDDEHYRLNVYMMGRE